MVNPSENAVPSSLTADEADISQTEVDRLDWEENQANGRGRIHRLDFLIFAGGLILLFLLFTVLFWWRVHR